MSSDEVYDEPDGSGYESGPFCRHWSDPGDCDRLCECGHRCHSHWRHDGECSVDGCKCIDFVDKQERSE